MTLTLVAGSLDCRAPTSFEKTGEDTRQPLSLLLISAVSSSRAAKLLTSSKDSWNRVRVLEYHIAVASPKPATRLAKLAAKIHNTDLVTS